jgi:DNA (cytosine-5)-methyltransferase 1
MVCRWQVEIDDYATRVLEKHWPNVKRYRDVRECGAANLERVDLICGGFPCQPHSLAGKRLASADERDLWGEFARVIRELGPRWVLAENVPGILSSEAGRFFGRVLRDLATCGYDAEWSVLSACAMGAPHTRERLFVVAYPNGMRGLQSQRGIAYERQRPGNGYWWGAESRVGRVAYGVPAGVDRRRCLGNAVVPQVAEWIGNRIMEVVNDHNP